MNSALSYTRTQVALHWTIVAILVLQYVLADSIETLWDQRMNGTVPNVPTPTIHTVLGLIVLGLMVWRLVLRLRHPVAPLPSDEPPLLKQAARFTHLAFYGFLIAMPIGGAGAWFFGVEAFAEAHGVAAKVLFVLILLHIAGALAQRYWFKSQALQRMSPRIALHGHSDSK